jgi:hypothetical protein
MVRNNTPARQQQSRTGSPGTDPLKPAVNASLFQGKTPMACEASSFA